MKLEVAGRTPVRIQARRVRKTRRYDRLMAAQHAAYMADDTVAELAIGRLLRRCPLPDRRTGPQRLLGLTLSARRGAAELGYEADGEQYRAHVAKTVADVRAYYTNRVVAP